MNDAEKSAVITIMITLSSNVCSLETEEQKTVFKMIAQYVANRYKVDMDKMTRIMLELIRESKEVNDEILLEMWR